MPDDLKKRMRDAREWVGYGPAPLMMEALAALERAEALIERLRAEIERLRADRDELLMVLGGIRDDAYAEFGGNSQASQMREKVRAAIAKAEKR